MFGVYLEYRKDVAYRYILEMQIFLEKRSFSFDVLADYPEVNKSWGAFVVKSKRRNFSTSEYPQIAEMHAVRLYFSLICDGVHVNSSIFICMITRKL